MTSSSHYGDRKEGSFGRTMYPLISVIALMFLKLYYEGENPPPPTTNHASELKKSPGKIGLKPYRIFEN